MNLTPQRPAHSAQRTAHGTAWRLAPGAKERLLARTLWLVGLSLACGFGSGTRLAAQSRWTHYTNTNQIHALAVDGAFVWVGTSGGLKLYDQTARQWTVLTPENGLPHHHINALAVAGDQVWVGSREGGLAAYRKEAQAWQSVVPEEGGPAERVLALAVDGDKLWVGTEGRGVLCYDPAAGWKRWTTAEGLSHNTVYALAVGQRSVWAGTEQGLSEYDRARGAWLSYQTADGILSGRVEALHALDGVVWIATRSNGVAVLDTDAMKLRPFKHVPGLGDGHYYALAGDRDTLWLGTGCGLLQVDLPTEEWRLIPGTDWRITALSVSPEALWVGTASAGVRRYDRTQHTWEAFLTRDILPGNDVCCLAPGNASMWLGLREEGVLKLDLDTGQWHEYDEASGLASKQTRGLATLGPTAWVATPQGLSRYAPETDRWTTYTSPSSPLCSNNLTSLVLHRGYLWMAGEGGLTRCSPEMKEWRTWRLEGLQVEGDWPRLVADRFSGSLWLVSPREAWRYDPDAPEAESWTVFRQPFRSQEAGRETQIQAVAIDVGSVWFACADGLRQYDKQLRKWWIHDDRAGVPLHETTCLALGRETVWCGTGHGLFRFDRVQRTWSEVSAEHLPSPHVTALALDQDSLWVATQDGVSCCEVARDEWLVFGPQAGLVEGLRDVYVAEDRVWFTGEGGISVYEKPREPGP